MLNIDNEFRQPVSIDFAPAAQALIVLGGRCHNDGGYFCSVCGKEFIRLVASDLRPIRADFLCFTSKALTNLGERYAGYHL